MNIHFYFGHRYSNQCNTANSNIKEGKLQVVESKLKFFPNKGTGEPSIWTNNQI